jgi:hypothetical protein
MEFLAWWLATDILSNDSRLFARPCPNDEGMIKQYDPDISQRGVDLGTTVARMSAGYLPKGCRMVHDHQPDSCRIFAECLPAVVEGLLNVSRLFAECLPANHGNLSKVCRQMTANLLYLLSKLIIINLLENNYVLSLP